MPRDRLEQAAHQDIAVQDYGAGRSFRASSFSAAAFPFSRLKTYR